MAELTVEIFNDVLAAHGRHMEKMVHDEIMALRLELRTEITSVRTGLQGEIAAVRTELREVKRRLGKIERSVNGMKPRLDAHERRFARIGHGALS